MVLTQNDVPDTSGSLSASISLAMYPKYEATISSAKIKEADDAVSVSTTRLHMCAIFHSKHTKLKTMKIYSTCKGVSAKHTKISTNENFLLYGRK